MRQANSTIRGFLYQFNKSIYEILCSNDEYIITLEGVIEDIDIQSHNSITTIQCKYHEDKKFQISNIADPILEMLCHYNECRVIGKKINYILYAYYAENVPSIDFGDFLDFIGNTTNKEIQLSYFQRIYTITEKDILDRAIKSKKNKEDKEKICEYYRDNREKMQLCVDVEDFWTCFKYYEAEQFDVLNKKICEKLAECSDSETSHNLYYPNAFALISELSSKANIEERKITRVELLEYLKARESVLINKWTLVAMDKKRLLRSKKSYLSSFFSSNASIRTFIFSDEFMEKNADKIIPFINDYCEKYYKKRKLQKPPIFIFGDNSEEKMNEVILGLHMYQKSVNSGSVANSFVPESFINNTDCAADFICKITLLKNVDDSLFVACNVNQSYIIGNLDRELESSHFITEKLDIESLQILRYLVGLDKTWEVK